MNDSYSHMNSNVFYVAENIMGPVEKSTEYEELLNNFNSQLLEYCNCDQVCPHASCGCFRKTCDKNYINCRQDEPPKFKVNFKTESMPKFECNDSCLCSDDCGNRIVQRGPIEGLEVRYCDKGFGLYTKQLIPDQSFVCEYAGELITKSQAAVRHKINLKYAKMNYIFCLKEHYGQNVLHTFVDPSIFGNIGRYINHSCEPNCYIVPVRCNSLVPKLAIFACTNIMPNNEITFHYGSVDTLDSENVENKIICLCKSKSCNGFMPFHKY